MQLSHAYGPGDITCVAVVPGAALVVDEVTDASFSEHVDKIPIRRLGHRSVVGYATGSGTFAGTLVCAQLTKGAFWKVRNYFGAVRVFGEQVLARQAKTKLVEPGAQFFASAVSVTQLPPIHLMWVHTNEQGQMSIQRWYNVVFSDKGGVFGASNRFTEQTLQYQCSYQEEIRLHRSLTVHEMQKLRERMSTAPGFFSDYHGHESLVESLSAVSTELAKDYSFDGLADYLRAETEGYARAARAGEATSMGVFDTGGVVFGPKGQAESGLLATAAAVADAVAAAGGAPVPGGEAVSPDFELEADLEEDVPVSASPTAVEFAKGRGTLVVTGGRVYVVPQGATRSAAHDVGAATSGSVTLDGDDYLGRLGARPAAGVATPAVPRAVTLSFGPAGARRAAAAGPAVPVSRSGGTPAYEVSVGAAWPDAPWFDSYRLTTALGVYSLSGTAGPASIPGVVGVAAGPNTWRFPTPVGPVTLVVADGEARLSRAPSEDYVWLAEARVPVARESYGVLKGRLERDGFALDARFTPAERKVSLVLAYPDGHQEVALLTGVNPGASASVEMPGALVDLEMPVNETARPRVFLGVPNRATTCRVAIPAGGGAERLRGPGVDLTVDDGAVSGSLLGAAVSDVPLGDAVAYPGTALRAVVSRTAVRFERPDKTL